MQYIKRVESQENSIFVPCKDIFWLCMGKLILVCFLHSSSFCSGSDKQTECDRGHWKWNSL